MIVIEFETVLMIPYHTATRSYGHMVIWSYGHMVIWSYGHMVIRHSTAFAVLLTSFYFSFLMSIPSFSAVIASLYSLSVPQIQSQTTNVDA